MAMGFLDAPQAITSSISSTKAVPNKRIYSVVPPAVLSRLAIKLI
jgi:hypothetical protein